MELTHIQTAATTNPPTISYGEGGSVSAMFSLFPGPELMESGLSAGTRSPGAEGGAAEKVIDDDVCEKLVFTWLPSPLIAEIVTTATRAMSSAYSTRLAPF